MLVDPPLDFLSTLSKIRVTRLALNPVDGAKVSFELDADFREVSRGGGKVKLSYALTVDTLPAVQRATMEGSTTVAENMVPSAKQDNSLEGQSLNDLALAIFKQHYEPLYLLFDTLSLAAPSPWLVRDVRLHT